jgi:hypothetical protein
MRRVTRTVTPPTPLADRFLTTAEAAKVLQVSVDTLLELDVPWIPIGTGRRKPRRRYLASALFEWGRRRQAPSADVWKARRPA